MYSESANRARANPLRKAMLEVSTPTVLIVDDTPENLVVLSELLQPLYTVRAATSGERALRVARSTPRPDIVLLDVMMPNMDGYQVFDQLRADASTRDIPVIFVTAMDSVDAEMRGLEAGAVDYITKPIIPSIVLARVHTQLELKQARDWLRDKNAFLEIEVSRRMAENELIQEVGIRALAHLAETRDPETGNHILRTQAYVQEIANGLLQAGISTGIVDERYVRLLARSAPLHDIGKVGIPDAILQKSGPLTDAEWSVMKTHAKLGSDAIELAERDAVQPVEFLTLAKEIAHWHHERWDGAGYPDGLAGASIPLSARVMALADVFDALISPRVYKKPITQEAARDIIAAGRGAHFDPDIVDIFLARFETIQQIARRYREPNTP
jgi:putative two-component system response regulator